MCIRDRNRPFALRQPYSRSEASYPNNERTLPSNLGRRSGGLYGAIWGSVAYWNSLTSTSASSLPSSSWMKSLPTVSYSAGVSSVWR